MYFASHACVCVLFVSLVSPKAFANNIFHNPNAYECHENGQTCHFLILFALAHLSHIYCNISIVLSNVSTVDSRMRPCLAMHTPFPFIYSNTHTHAFILHAHSHGCGVCHPKQMYSISCDLWLGHVTQLATARTTKAQRKMNNQNMHQF